MDQRRRLAFYALREVEDNKAYSHLALLKVLRGEGEKSGPFVRELTYGVIRHKKYLDYCIAGYLSEPISKLKQSDLILLRMGLYQIMFMDKVPEHSAVDETVELAKTFAKGRQGFINAVLREYIRNPEKAQLPDINSDYTSYLSIKYSFEPWIIDMWLEEIGEEETPALLRASNKAVGLTLRVNTLKTTRDHLYKRLASKGYEVSLTKDLDNAIYVLGGSIVSSPYYEQGLFSIQDEASIRVVEAVDPKPGEVVIDVCAAPGGKTMAMAEKMENYGKIFAWDIYRKRLQEIVDHANRLGVDIVKVESWDSEVARKEFVEKADKVLVDVPCSGLGTIRKKPEIKYKKWDKELGKLPSEQHLILVASSEYVKKGGTMVYSTCTISKRENQDVVEAFLRDFPNFEKVEERQLLPHIDDTDGFYICKMIKKDDVYG